MIVKISTTIFYQFQIIFGEVRTFFPRKTVICYGLVRFFGDEACQISTILMIYVMIEFFFILYALNGQYNTICRKTSFHDNNSIQIFSFLSLTIMIILFFALFMLSYISRDEAISQIYMNYNDTKAFVNDSYAIAACGESKMNFFMGVMIVSLIFFINYISHYTFLFVTMSIFTIGVKNLSKESIIQNQYTKRLTHHLISVALPIVIVLLPLMNLIFCIYFMNDEEHFWITKVTTNSLIKPYDILNG
ncbi:Hypothetical protein SRAE_X000013950 [Strongyloides ratti]|uniref:Uncharacterized protein n=1 Tax=Strongyloides ratti TaxID=34506 RepID=A0A090LT81_STRRB|nr:Hypothetical protein SRAE_X000013950 [Strongyloides ratti]CEF70809.1 Hypothetical protein SRAE_X000013950 [Strongyloides ratti]